jgi:hypothetical protein
VQSAVDEPPQSKKVGGKFRISDTVRNVGASLAGGSATRFYLSADELWSEDDVLLGGLRSVPELPPDATSTGTTRVTIPAGTAAGAYYLVACADNTELVVESDETDNCTASTGTIQVTTGGGGGRGNGPPGGRGGRN